MPTTRTPRQAWIDEGLRAMASGGPDAVRVEVLARTLGVSKGGFYWHFENRQAFMDEVLEAWERRSIDEVIEHVEAVGGDAKEKLRRLFLLAAPGHGLLRVDLAVRDWARRDSAIAARLRRVDNRRMAYLRSLFAEFCEDDEDVDGRCVLALSLFVGSHFLAVDHRPRTRMDVVYLATRHLLA